MKGVDVLLSRRDVFLNHLAMCDAMQEAAIIFAYLAFPNGHSNKGTHMQNQHIRLAFCIISGRIPGE